MKLPITKLQKLFSKKIVFWASLSLFIASYILLTLQNVASGSRFALLEKEERELNQKNRELTMQIMESTSLTQINAKSELLGFQKPENTLYIKGENSVAKLP